MKNIREYLQWDKNYSVINREERNLAAVFYHTLLQGDNLRRFLEMIKCPFTVEMPEMGVYFEYAYIRDLWFQIQDNEKRKGIIYSCLQPQNIEQVKSMSTFEFNQYFGAVPKPSHEFIQSPGQWSLARYANTIQDRDEFLKVCKFKWSFNAKPDIVIHTSKSEAVCIEAKLESVEGYYPQKADEHKIFQRRDLEYVKQTALQKYLMETLLGMTTQFLFLVQDKKQSSETHQTVTWTDVFEYLDTDDLPNFIQEIITSLDK